MTLLALLGLGSWRLASLLKDERGPYDVFGRLRRSLGVERPGELSELGELWTCIWCLSLHTAALLYALIRLAPRLAVPLLYVLSASTVAILTSREAVRGGN